MCEGARENILYRLSIPTHGSEEDFTIFLWASPQHGVGEEGEGETFLFSPSLKLGPLTWPCLYQQHTFNSDFTHSRFLHSAYLKSPTSLHKLQASANWDLLMSLWSLSPIMYLNFLVRCLDLIILFKCSPSYSWYKNRATII